MKIHLAYIFACVAVCFVMFCFCKNRLLKKDRQCTELQSKLDNLSVYHTYKRFREEELRLNGQEINRMNLDPDGKNETRLEGMINNNTLVMYFSEYSCEQCVSAQTALLDKWRDSIGYNVIFFVHASNIRYLSILKSKINYPVYRVHHQMGVLDFPILFVIDEKSMRINSAYFPMKEYPDETEKYLKYVKNTYFSKY